MVSYLNHISFHDANVSGLYLQVVCTYYSLKSDPEGDIPGYQWGVL